MSLALAGQQLHACCDALASVEAGTPTLCAGWTAHDLAIHLWVLGHDPLAWPGVALPVFAGLGEARAARVRARWPYPELIDRLRAQRPALACMPLDRFEDWRHCLGEYYVHTQDVARANRLPRATVDPALEDALWLRLQRAAPQVHRRRTPGLVLVRDDGQRFAAGRGPARLEVRGPASELICWVYGRTAVADVEVRPARATPGSASPRR